MFNSMKGRCIIGTSGWSYDHWQGIFYPENLKSADRLRYYASQFESVEINNSFYRLPSEEAFIKWKETVPENFIFSIKGSRYITHMKKLKNSEAATATFIDRAKLLGHHLGPILFQLPPYWHYNGDRFHTFLSALDPALRFAFEFRDSSWFTEEAYGLLEKHGAALCLYHMPGFETPKIVTTSFTYIRFHGMDNLYAGAYPDKEILRWGGIISGYRDKGIDIYAYFNNDAAGNAVTDARRLGEVLNVKRYKVFNI